MERTRRVLRCARLKLRARAGLAVAGRDEKMAEAIDRADRAMYAGEAAGRDRWVWADA